MFLAGAWYVDVEMLMMFDISMNESKSKRRYQNGMVFFLHKEMYVSKHFCCFCNIQRK